MDKGIKRFKPMICPVCEGMYFSGPFKDTYDEDVKKYLNGEVQCSHCGWIYDLDQAESPDLLDGYNSISLNEYKEWFSAKIKEQPDYDYSEANARLPIPHKCPVCGEYEFEDELSSDICPVCGWEDTGFEENPDEKPSPYMMSYNETLEWFKQKRKENPKYRWINDNSDSSPEK